MPKSTAKSRAAVLLGHARWKGRSAAEKSAHGRMMRAIRTLKDAAKKKSA
jgi:hypothetical protein